MGPGDPRSMDPGVPGPLDPGSQGPGDPLGTPFWDMGSEGS